MRELLYIQLGPFSNHVGAHFWNAQESYFMYDGEGGMNVSGDRDDGKRVEETREVRGEGRGEGGVDVDVDHDVSFREGVSWGRKAEPTYCPRVLIFDHKSNFGALGKYNELYGDDDEESGEELVGTWSGSVHEHRQPRIDKSEYLRRLDEGEEDGVDEDSDADNKGKVQPVNTGRQAGSSNSSKPSFTPQYWSDYNRMYFIPRSIHALPDVGEEKPRDVYGFGRGKALFKRYEQERELMEGDFRKFVEECDQMQGIHISFDAYASSPFSGFTSAFLESIREDFSKASVLTVPVGVGRVESGGLKGEQEPTVLQRTIHDISTFLALEEHANGSIPLLDPSGSWSEKGEIVPGFEFSPKSAYESSAILSAHLESATLPLRLKSSPTNLSSLLAQLNWSQSDPFSALGGLLGSALTSGAGDSKNTVPLFDFSEGRKYTTAPIIAQHLVSRGQTSKDVASYLVREGRYFTTHGLSVYPVLSSSPPFMRRFARGLLRKPAPSMGAPTRTASVPLALLSSLHTNPTTTATRFASYASLIDARIRNNTWRDLVPRAGDGVVGADDSGGIGGDEGVGNEIGTKDEFKEVVERLWKVAEGCGWNGGDDDGEGGEDD